jgi:hypothetical protein
VQPASERPATLKGTLRAKANEIGETYETTFRNWSPQIFKVGLWGNRASGQIKEPQALPAAAALCPFAESLINGRQLAITRGIFFSVGPKSLPRLTGKNC